MEGGHGSALRHYEASGRRYPLVVKLGTISPHGADVYSYAPDEDDMVLDPHLARHLAHWGINMMQVGWVGALLAGEWVVGGVGNLDELRLGANEFAGLGAQG
jgi:hypothetical protein